MNIVKAESFAKHHHEGQKYGDKEYSFHLEAVVKVAEKFNLNNEIIIGCWLHDVIEDCDVSYNEVKQEFGESIAEIVYAVTDELGRNRKERKLKTYPKIAAIEAATCVKLCDRIANLNQTIIDKESRLLSMYLEEHNEFKNQLYNIEHSNKTREIWTFLEVIINENLVSQ